MASFPPLKKSLFRIITVITIICLLVISCTIPASAFSDTQFPDYGLFPTCNIPISRPQLDGQIVYAEILSKYGSQGEKYRVFVVVFNLAPQLSDDFICIPTILNNNQIQFEFKFGDREYDNEYLKESINFSCYYYDSKDGFINYDEAVVVSDNYLNWLSLFNFNYGIYGIHYYGCQISSASTPQYNYEFVVNYASEGLIVNYLKYFKDTFSRSLDILNQSISALDDKFVGFAELCIMYLNAQLSHLSNIDIYLETLTEQNNQLINGPPGSDEEASPPPNVVAPPRDDSTIDDIKEAEKDAVGGKTDEEIKEDIEDTLDFEDKKDEVNGEEIETSDIEVSHNTFNLVFDFMGGAWNSYFILSLTIAFAAFLIGRRY